jgi:hypothetical protein
MESSLAAGIGGDRKDGSHGSNWRSATVAPHSPRRHRRVVGAPARGAIHVITSSSLTLLEDERLPEAPDRDSGASRLETETPPGRRRHPDRAALIGLLAGTAVLYLWALDRSGWANTFYSAAVQAGTRSWKAFFFGSSDSSNFITVDKPPISLWPMEIAARIFGLSSWSVLVPQALEGVASVALLYSAVRRWFGARAGLLAGVVLALTPVATLMFRFNNPDALLVLLLTAAAYCTVRALERGSTRWLLAVAALVGTGFLTKYLQASTSSPPPCRCVGACGSWRRRPPSSSSRRPGGSPSSS